MMGCRQSILAIGLIACFLPASVQAGTDANGFFDTYLVALGFDAAGAAPGAAAIAQDYLCDGDISESTILPEDGFELFDPSLAFPTAEECGGRTPANSPFDENALLVGGALPITTQTVNNTTLDFNSFIAAAEAANVMAYAWVYVNNLTDEPLDLVMGVGSDDSIQVQVNRVEVFSLNLGRGSGGAGTIQDRFPVRFQPGGNLVQFKVWQGGGGWNMRARLEIEGDCPPGARQLGQEGGPVLSDPAGILTVDTVPLALPDVVAATRTINATGDAPGQVTADVEVAIDNAGAPWNLVETFDPSWNVIATNPAPSASAPGQLSWTGVTADTITYSLQRSGAWNQEDEGVIQGENTLNTFVSDVGGENIIFGGLTPYVRHALLTAALNIADADDMGVPVAIQGCNVDPSATPWIIGDDGEGAPVTDSSIVPEEGLEIQIDWGGLEGGASGSDTMSFVTPESEEKFWVDPGFALGPMKLAPVRSADGNFNFERADIYGAVDDTMNGAYFYAVNNDPTPREVLFVHRSDDSGSVYLNGNLVHSITACRGVGNFDIADRFRMTLDPGKNLISVYTFENGGGFGFIARFEDEQFRPIRIPTTLDPTGYDPADHTDPGIAELLPPLFVDELLATAAMGIGGGFHGSNIPVANIRGEWITGEDGSGSAVDDATIVPFEGMQIFPDFGGASQATGLLEIAQTAKDVYWTDPLSLDPLADGVGTNVVRVTSGDGFYNWQRGDIFTGAPDPDVCMNVAWFYAINESAEPRCVTLSFGSDDSGGVRLNGFPVHAITVGRGTPAFGASDKIRMELDPGKNLISCYTFDNGGGWGLRVRFEDDRGNPLAIPVTTDPAGYDPGAHDDIFETCTDDTSDDAYVRDTSSGANGIVTSFLVPANVMEHGNTGGGGCEELDAAENYVSVDGDPPEIGNIFEGAFVQPGITGIEDPLQLPVTTAIRGASCGFTPLVLFDGLVDGDGAGDPGDLDSNAFYGETTQYSTSMFFYVENLTNDPLPAWFAFASDDCGSLFLNGEPVVFFANGRGRGGNNVLQTYATAPADLLPGENLVQFSFKQGGGGAGARVGLFADDCFFQTFGPDQVRVTANPPGFVPGAGRPTATREVSSYGCDNTGEVTLTIQTSDGGEADVVLEEVLPDGMTGSAPTAGTFNGAGTVLTLDGQVADGTQITYQVENIIPGGSFCASTINGGPIDGDGSFSTGDDTCRSRCQPLSDLGGVPEMLIIGPIDAGGVTSPDGVACDDNGLFFITDYLASDSTSEEDLEVGLGDELAPDFGGAASGVGVKGSPNPDINPRANEGILTVWLADADDEGRINLNDGDNIGDPVDDYIVFGLTYLENTTGEDLPVTLEVGSDDAVKVLVNGEQVFTNPACRGVPAYEAGDRILTTLFPGRNTVLIGVVERGGGTDIRLVVRDEFDFPIVDDSVIACRLSEDDGGGDDPEFRRGDVDGSGMVDISDPIANLTNQFLGGFIPCRDAADYNDSGAVDISDPIANLTNQFLGGPPAAPPGSVTCGPDPTPDVDGDLGCENPPTNC